MAPRFTKLPLTAHALASGDKGPRPITDDLASGGEGGSTTIVKQQGGRKKQVRKGREGGRRRSYHTFHW